MLQLVVRLHVIVLDLMAPPASTPVHRGRRLRGDRGQATAEYALVLLGAALVALLLVAWATAGGGGGKIGRLLDRVLDSITSKVG
jgi:hypothetical protein